MAVAISRVEGKELEAAIPALAALLREAVEHGAALGFRAPPSLAEAERVWRGWASDAARVVLVARDGEEIVGTCQLDMARNENAAHRAELAKLIVRRDQRGRGVGSALVDATLAEAGRRGRTTVWLATVEPRAERIYARAGFAKVGVIPRWIESPAGVWRDSSFWWIHLR